MIYLALFNIYFKKGQHEFKKALESWFEINDTDKWLEKYGDVDLDDNFMDLLKSHYNWCFHSNIVHTPSVFIAGYKYPNLYDMENIEFFINDLLEDPLQP
ncbi:hypothetical protein [Flavobacterium sp. YO12]|uniref:hypothetical protein n=1 Tax=Flavobacterium sp. YO12 TaxID=1920029 RepID=UPI00100B0B57|nr:hypothetical protein [Flavobacterium sp. YO12]RXM42302.1 hypothetical protein BOW55_20735 [Flavobacterium sp. YO12]